MRSIFRVMFYLRSNYVNKNGKASVMIRIYLDSERTSLGASGVYVSPEQWDSKNNKVKGRTSEALQTNLQLEGIRAHLTSMYKKMEADECLSVELIKSKFLGKKTEMDTIIDLFDAYIANQSKLVGISISSTTLKKYDVCKRHFQNFLEEQYKRSDLFIKEVVYAVVFDFDLYLRTIARQNVNTANKTMRTFRTVILFGNKLGLFRTDPFVGYKPQSTVHTRGFLTDEELISIMKKEFSLQRLSFVRDIFIFSCFTGLSYIDISMLRYGNIVYMNDQKWIMTNRKKTNIESNVLLLEIPEQIIEKYHNDEATDESLIFPMLSNQKTNSYLKEIADLCGIKKNLTFHMARHTFATMSLSKGVPMESVSKMLGHTNIKTTQIYARITNKKIEHDMLELSSKLQKFNQAMNL
ncbi:MAG: site-specific integrase [Bacteroides pyogenes]|uniref:site-specific integrase n=1 Tax=Bacteroides pyogenes TaxID=310300 RepID=UPI00242DC789|nr:site-specific integrase [Bacteroides pyogenes]MCI7069868.1 site-specific integrase [Bacteroides pyogenes]MDY3090815.1 tyrosine-type recombinase/integrase [Porphyromonas sp.]MDY5353088.1 tyrosine-type recombinase/integrase [Bacteroides pyogenes]